MGKTSLLERLAATEVVYFDDPVVRDLANADPRLFLDQKPTRLVLDEAPRAPNLFLELKRRVDEARRLQTAHQLDYWVTGSNQTLLQRSVKESLAGRANFFDLNTLSLHELQATDLSHQLLRGGWPELRTNHKLDSVRYLNDLISAFIERDIVTSAGVTKTGPFNKLLQLNAGRVGQQYIPSELAQACGVDQTTVQSWNQVLAQNGILTLVPAYHSNLQKRLTRTAKLYFQDVSVAVRLQGWTTFQPIFTTPMMGHFFENIVYSEIHRFFINHLLPAKIYHLRTKEKVEVDFLVELPNQCFVAIEAKMTPSDFTDKQVALTESLKLNNLADRITVSHQQSVPMRHSQNILAEEIWEKLESYLPTSP